MSWWGSGFVPIIIYATTNGANLETGAILTESGIPILTEDGFMLLIEE